MSKRYLDLRIRAMSDQEVANRYTKEKLTLKMLLAARMRGERRRPAGVGYPNTLMMNLCKRELDRRGLPILLVILPAEHQSS